MALTLLPLIDDQKCFQAVRELHWPDGVTCLRTSCGPGETGSAVGGRLTKQVAICVSGCQCI